MASIGSSHSGKRRKSKRLRLHAAPRPPPPPPEKLTDPIVGDLKVICNHCACLFKFRADEKEFGKLKSHFDNTYCSKLRNEESKEEEEKHSSQGSKGTCVEVSAYTYKNARKMIAKNICTASLPFKFAETEQFEDFMKACNPLGHKVPSIEIVREIGKQVRESILVLKKDLVKLSNKVSICCDVWSNDLGCQFVRITCHWVDESWAIQKRLIAFRVLYEGTRTPAEIALEMQKSLQNYGSDSKVFSISFDNQTVNTYSLEALSDALQPSISADFFHARCLNNILTMCVEDALSALEKELAPIRNAATGISFADTSLLRKWVAFCQKKGLVPRKFVLHYPGFCWYLSYRMINRCYEYRDVLCSFLADEKLEDAQVDSSQFEACSSLHQLLGSFYRAVEELSRVYQPTSVLVLENCVKIAVMLDSLARRDGLAPCVAKMKGIWLKHFEEIPTVFSTC
ncbi:zinc finger BED domain-containing protein RICESLEEPER 2-like [Salvia divinorum]|uniref:Zinc finger BED domain-containing protein RICESLEEPER 2-like n=1 Tax=Salvia divinorum TaxID=28513 RepID=A0ABD1HI00_SALDI